MIHERVAFVIFTMAKGVGGHYLSLSQTANAHFFKDSLIIDIGYSQSELLVEQAHSFVNFSMPGLHLVRNRVRRIIIDNKVEKVLCYDIPSLIILRSVCRDVGVPFSYVKCGGPQLTAYYPKAENILVYSEEDLAFFGRRLPASSLTLLPNRISVSEILEKQVLLPHLGTGSAIRVVCISRIGPAYARKIELAARYVDALQASGLDSSLTVIGSVEERQTYVDIKKKVGSAVRFLTDPPFTDDSAKYLKNFDVAVTTGRGTFEAAALGLRCLVPANNSSCLVPLRLDNYSALKSNNFSGRTVLGVDCKDISTEPSNEELETIRQWIIADFAIEEAGGRFREFIDSMVTSNTRLFDEFVSFLYLIYVTQTARSRVFRMIVAPARHINRTISHLRTRARV